MRISGVLQEHLSSVKRDVEMWLEGEISDKVEVDLGTGDLDTAVLRFLARNCPDKVQYLEREYQMKITERSMIFTGMSISVLSHDCYSSAFSSFTHHRETVAGGDRRRGAAQRALDAHQTPAHHHRSGARAVVRARGAPSAGARPHRDKHALRHSGPADAHYPCMLDASFATFVLSHVLAL